ncbi:MAG: N-acetyl-gamma-glutamyl-phosphate reductase [Anaerovoracaceae bacterium]
MKYKVFVDGAHGTTGLRIREYLDKRDDIEQIVLPDDRRKDLGARVEAACGADISILCLPDSAAAEMADAVPDDVRLIDTSTAHRTADGWVYGFPELYGGARQAIKESSRVANPGCHATGLISLIRPLVEKKVIASSYPVTSFCITGYSGGGKKMIAQYEDPDRDSLIGTCGQYGIAQEHKHLPEMKKYSCLDSEPSFCPVVGDFYSGMVMTAELRKELLEDAMSPEDIKEVYREYYSGEKMIHVADAPESGFIYGGDMTGRNDLRITVTGNEDRILVISEFDNLGKGASGAAVQNMNIMLGIEETKGLI